MVGCSCFKRERAHPCTNGTKWTQWFFSKARIKEVQEVGKELGCGVLGATGREVVMDGQDQNTLCKFMKI